MPTPSTRSAALAIVRPSSTSTTTSTTNSSANASLSSPAKKPSSLSQSGADTSSAWSTSNNSNKLCKNIAIFGSCKYQGKGCAFSHDVDGKRSNAPTPSSSRPTTPASFLTVSSTSFTPSAPVFTPASAAVSTPTTPAAITGPASPSISNSALNNPFASLAANANVFVPKSISTTTTSTASASASTPTPLTYASSVVSTPKTEVPPSSSSSIGQTKNTTSEQATTTSNNSNNNENQQTGHDEDEDEDEDFDGLNPYAAVQSPASTSGNLPTLSSSYHSAHSTHSGGIGGSIGGGGGGKQQTSPTASSSYNPSTPSFEPSYPVHEQARIPDEGHTGQQQQQQHQHQFQQQSQQQQQEYGQYDDYTNDGQFMHHNQQMPNLDATNPYLNGRMQGLELYGQVMHQPLQYHLYHPSLPHLTPAHLNQHSHVMQNFFMSPTIREELQRKQEACYPPSILAPDRDILLNDRYWGLIPLDKNSPHLSNNGGNNSISSRLYGWRSWLFRCTNDRDGKTYAVRRMEGYRLTNPESIMLIEKWSHVIHPSIVGVREAFTTRAFGDHSVCFVYDYHPLSSTLLEIHLTTPARGAPAPPPLPERVLWSYLVQLASAVRTVHKAGMAVRCLDPSKIIITGKNRVRINGIGILDVLAYDGGKNTASFQQEDLLSLGKLFLSLACRSLSAIHNIQQSLDMGVSRTYTSDFSNALLYLLSKPNPQRKNIDEFLGIISGHVDDELRGAFDQADLLEGDLMRELENGRLFRLMAKFGFINERPEYDHDPRWAETGDRYIIKLFRDYVFHQIDEHGRPVIDLSHVLTCLNKLDAGVDEQIVLISRDEQSCLIVSYREVRACLENSFRELAR